MKNTFFPSIQLYKQCHSSIAHMKKVCMSLDKSAGTRRKRSKVRAGNRSWENRICRGRQGTCAQASGESVVAGKFKRQGRFHARLALRRYYNGNYVRVVKRDAQHSLRQRATLRYILRCTLADDNPTHVWQPIECTPR